MNMSFDIPQIHLPDNSPEARAIEAIISRDHVTAEEVVRSAIRGLAADALGSARAEDTKPGELLFGLFADEPDLMDQIARDARSARDQEIVRQYSA